MKKVSAESFGDNLDIKLKELGITQRELAQRVGMREATISMYIKGKWLPKIDTFCAICNALNVKPKHLLAYPLYVREARKGIGIYRQDDLDKISMRNNTISIGREMNINDCQALLEANVCTNI